MPEIMVAGSINTSGRVFVAEGNSGIDESAFVPANGNTGKTIKEIYSFERMTRLLLQK